jgi:hypothetical protein
MIIDTDTDTDTDTLTREQAEGSVVTWAQDVLAGREAVLTGGWASLLEPRRAGSGARVRRRGEKAARDIPQVSG